MDYALAKNYILKLWTEKPRQAKRVVREEWLQLHTLLSAYEGKNLSEKAYRFYNDIPDGRQCENCRQPAIFLDFRRGYTDFCGIKCMANSPRIQNQKKKTNTVKYGVSHFSKTDEYKRKFTSTCQLRYGVNNPGQIVANQESRSRAKQMTYFNGLLLEIADFTIPRFTFDEYTYVRDTELPWQCVTCDNEFTSSTFGKLPKCPKCFVIGNVGAQSSIEKDVLAEIRKFYDGEILENSRAIITPQELDIYFPDKKFAIEVNGVYWHSSTHVVSSYHQDKFNKCQNAGITLFMVTDYEWLHHRELVLNMIKHRLGLKTTRIHTRKCTVAPINAKTAKEFLSARHIHGFAKASGHLGLWHNDELVAVLSYMKNHRFKKDTNKLEIVRLALAYTVPGALGKFIKYLLASYIGYDIITYADLRYGTGNVYLANNFKLLHTTKPGYWYLLKGVMYHRLSWTKKKLVGLGHDSSKTEHDIMAELGAMRIYDCGHNYYELANAIQK
jgi:hypothetical protein